MDVVKEVAMLTCCKCQCCPTYPWDKTKYLRTKYWSMSLNTNHEYAYAIVDYLHHKEEEVKMYITTRGVEVCEEQSPTFSFKFVPIPSHNHQQ
jgi:hypothetical protein